MTKRSNPIYGVYVSMTRIPRKKHDEMSEAIEEALRLAKLTGSTAFVIEYDKAPWVVCRCLPDGKMEQM
jgi:hypothetical protein